MTWIIPKNLHTFLCVQDMQALILDSKELSKTLEQSLIVKSKPMQSQIWFQKLKRDSWTQLLFGRILKHSRGKNFTIKWTSSQAVSRVNLSHKQVTEKQTMTQDIYSPTSKEVLNWSDLPLFSLKTLKESCHANLEKNLLTEKAHLFCFMSLENWKEWIIKQRREFSARQKLAHPTKEKEFLYWPTPTVRERTQNINTLFTKTGEIYQGIGTPYRKSKIQATLTLGQAIQYQNTGRQKEDQVNIFGSRQEPSMQTSKNLNAIHLQKLNPRWVETLMGVPIGWTMTNCVNLYVVEPTN